MENYLVAKDVFEELLKDEFHCHAEPQVREKVIVEFERRFSEFLQVTKEINRRLFIARRLGLRLAKGLPKSINHLAVVGLRSVAAGAFSPEAIVAFETEPPKEDHDQLTDEFLKLDPQTRYRGKFNHLFFIKWLDLLCSERRETDSEIFGRLQKPRTVSIQSISLGMLASKSSLPAGLSGFIEAVE
ncbi:hypothetical protein [Bradyrhizobium sp. AS23.2]|uniref:hypothetical protein n=1 Tax=Bradyrhizobium sp. AS23.2 TaxID=1680155 RepID=UPI001160FCD5|nr:hypothetical protein [Bradyrhizobium sp. AS23.2]